MLTACDTLIEVFGVAYLVIQDCSDRKKAFYLFWLVAYRRQRNMYIQKSNMLPSSIQTDF